MSASRTADGTAWCIPCDRAMAVVDESRTDTILLLRWLCPSGHSRFERIALPTLERPVPAKWQRSDGDAAAPHKGHPCGACLLAQPPPCAAHGGIPSAERKRRNSRARTQKLRERRLSLL